MKLGNLFSAVSREGSLVLNNVFLLVITGMVFLGTFYPLFAQVTSGAQISVGPPWYNLFFVPLSIALMIAMAVGPYLSWKRGDLREALFRLNLAGVVGLGAAVGVFWFSAGALAALGVGAAVWLLAASAGSILARLNLSGGLATAWSRALGLPRAAWGMAVAHAGTAVMALGIAGVTVWTTETVTLLKPGQTTSIAGYEVRLVSVGDTQGPNYTAKTARFAIAAGGASEEMIAERRVYPNPGSETTEAGLRVRPLDVLYVTIGQPHPDGSWTVRLWHHPLVVWIWGGAVVMVLGGFLSLSDRRLRIGAPRRAAVSAAAE
jgi:cytochrome c-type biogenesis protein CcmF